MGWHDVKIDRADTIFSQAIRLRDGRCFRCHTPVQFNDKGLPVSQQCSHFHSRRKESVRFHPDNCDSCCPGCHGILEKDKKGEYAELKLKQLGEARFNALTLAANTPGHKDRAMALLVARAYLEDIRMQRREQRLEDGERLREIFRENDQAGRS